MDPNLYWCNCQVIPQQTKNGSARKKRNIVWVKISSFTDLGLEKSWKNIALLIFGWEPVMTPDLCGCFYVYCTNNCTLNTEVWGSTWPITFWNVLWTQRERDLPSIPPSISIIHPSSCRVRQGSTLGQVSRPSQDTHAITHTLSAHSKSSINPGRALRLGTHILAVTPALPGCQDGNLLSSFLLFKFKVMHYELSCSYAKHHNAVSWTHN